MPYNSRTNKGTPMITNKEILELADDFLEEWEAEEDGKTWVEYSGTAQEIIYFAQQIRKDTLYEIIHLLSSVPNPEANRTAINRIEMELN
jgi:hypothetical protein